MSTVHQLPDPNDAERRAGDWIARLNADDITAEERGAFDSWLNAHPLHAKTYEELRRTWEEFKQAGRIVRVVSFGDAMKAAALPRVSAKTAWKSRGGRAMGVAAMIAAVCMVIFFTHEKPSPSQFQTAIGERAAIQLPDGSSLELNSDSMAYMEYQPRTRVIRLMKGEAFFRVAHDQHRPFWVVAGSSWVRAVGTAFNVKYVDDGTRSSRVRVVVTEGKVKVIAGQTNKGSPGESSLKDTVAPLLIAGQQADVRQGSTDVRLLDRAELTHSMAWRSPTVDFDGVPLSQAVAELTRYSDIEVIIETRELKQLPIGGTFTKNRAGVEGLITLLEEGFGLQVRRDEINRVLIKGEPRK